MNKEFEKEKLIYFFENLEKKNPLIILLLMTVSFGIYIIYWIYNLNLRFEEIDEDAPETNRGLTILIILPAIIYITTFFLEYIIFPEFKYFFYLKILFWGFVTYLSLKYFYDFCTTYAKITQTNPTIWYLCLYPGYYSVIFAAFQIYSTISLLIFTIITVTIMQYYLNTTSIKQINKEKSYYFNAKIRKS